MLAVSFSEVWRERGARVGAKGVETARGADENVPVVEGGEVVGEKGEESGGRDVRCIGDCGSLLHKLR